MTNRRRFDTCLMTTRCVGRRCVTLIPQSITTTARCLSARHPFWLCILGREAPTSLIFGEMIGVNKTKSFAILGQDYEGNLPPSIIVGVWDQTKQGWVAKIMGGVSTSSLKSKAG